MANATKKKASDVSMVDLINLPLPYCGAQISYQVIPAGSYRINDPLLLGQGEYLVKTKHAKVMGQVEDNLSVEEEEVIDEKDVPPPPEPPPAEPKA